MEELRHAMSVLDSDPDEAHGIASEILNDDPDCGPALHIVACLLCRAGRHGQALGLWEKLSRVEPKRAEVWNNLGQTYSECGQHDKALEAYRRSLAIRPDAGVMGNAGVACNEAGKYQEGLKWCARGLALDPEHANTKATRGFSRLALGDWGGWEDYKYSIGSKFRAVRPFGPAWDGSRVKRLVVYGEQGIGDEVMFASCLADAVKAVDSVALECDERLEPLFRRSFLGVDVYGTRRGDRSWAKDIDAQVPCGGLPEFFRPNRDSCPKVPYLKADPERVLQWKALFRSYGKPVIGLCWTGGNKYTRRALRKVGLDAFRPLIEAQDAVYVSLQYKDAADEIAASGLPVKDFPWATLTDDYDDTAAMVACLDRVVGIHTSVHHLAGALGVPSTILVPANPSWNYATGDRLPWYREQVFHRQRANESWADCVKRMVPVQLEAAA
jgi:hypothetical protein